jgi:hypothetical protein
VVVVAVEVKQLVQVVLVGRVLIIMVLLDQMVQPAQAVVVVYTIPVMVDHWAQQAQVEQDQIQEAVAPQDTI